MTGDNPTAVARLLAARWRSLRYVRAVGRRLAAQQAAAERELAELAQARAGLPAASLPVFDWGDLLSLVPTAAERGACLREFIRQYLAAEIAGWPGPLLEIIPEPGVAPLAGDAAAKLLTADEVLPETLRQLPAEHYAVILLPHILNLIPEPRQLLFACRRVLRHGGLLVATLPGSASPSGLAPERDCHRYTPAAAARLLGDYFPVREMDIATAGSMADAVAAWYGLAGRVWSGGGAAEMPLIIGVRARKP